ncbi:flavin reductase family protein [Streptomyces sp. NPDC004629]|uniref:flavin reductase family protein n=1 Tax=Streptomyces sp. NPDC004629 TaxID=3364705 RepID=UPI003674454D
MTTTDRPPMTGTSLGPSAFRAATRRLPTTVVVAGGLRDGSPVGMLVGTFTSVSLDPLLVGFLGDRGSSTLPLLLELEHMSFSVLDQDDIEAANRFRKPLDERFADLAWSVSAHGTPVIETAVMTFHTTVHSVIPAGDHQLVLGEVIAIEQRHPARRPLVFAEGRMTRLDPMHVVGAYVWELGWE